MFPIRNLILPYDAFSKDEFLTCQVKVTKVTSDKRD